MMILLQNRRRSTVLNERFVHIVLYYKENVLTDEDLHIVIK